jgi:hypothetical protein
MRQAIRQAMANHNAAFFMFAGPTIPASQT